MHYGDIDINRESSDYESAYRVSQKMASSNEASSINYPYSMRTNTQHGSIIASNSGVSDSLKSMYRAVEYTKSPQIERVRVKNSDDCDEFEVISSQQQEMSSRSYNQSIVDSYRTVDSNAIVYGDEDEKTFVVKLFPLDEQEKEVQEMTMYVESSNDKYFRSHLN